VVRSGDDGEERGDEADESDQSEPLQVLPSCPKKVSNHNRRDDSGEDEGDSKDCDFSIVVAERFEKGTDDRTDRGVNSEKDGEDHGHVDEVSVLFERRNFIRFANFWFIDVFDCLVGRRVLWLLSKEQDESCAGDADHEVLGRDDCVHSGFNVVIILCSVKPGENQGEKSSNRGGETGERRSHGSLSFREPDRWNQTRGCDNSRTRYRLTQSASQEVPEAFAMVTHVSAPGSTNLDSDRDSENFVFTQAIVSLHRDEVHRDIEQRAQKGAHVDCEHGHTKGLSHRKRDGSERNDHHEVVEEDCKEDEQDHPAVPCLLDFDFGLLARRSRS